jgi:uncharacterized protein YegP (UPF0339 family)
MEHPKFVVTKSGSRFYFHLTAESGEVILNSELYSRQGTVDEGVAAVKTNAPLDARYDRRSADTDTGQRYFVLTAPNGDVIGTSEMYASEAAREMGIESVKRNAPGAGVEE